MKRSTTKTTLPATGPLGGRPRVHPNPVSRTISFDASHIAKLADIQHDRATENRSATVCLLVDEAHKRMVRAQAGSAAMAASVGKKKKARTKRAKAKGGAR